jgi:hypothetical protein
VPLTFVLDRDRVSPRSDGVALAVTLPLALRGSAEARPLALAWALDLGLRGASAPAAVVDDEVEVDGVDDGDDPDDGGEDHNGNDDASGREDDAHGAEATPDNRREVSQTVVRRCFYGGWRPRR